MINETQSQDSTLESPTKPHQEKDSSQKKQIFLVHYINNNLSFNETNEKVKTSSEEEFSGNKKKKVWRRGRKPKKITKIKKILNNVLDFDNILDTFFPKKTVSPLKIKKNSSIKKNKKKLIGCKRKRQLNEMKSKSKYNIFL